MIRESIPGLDNDEKIMKRFNKPKELEQHLKNVGDNEMQQLAHQLVELSEVENQYKNLKKVNDYIMKYANDKNLLNQANAITGQLRTSYQISGFGGEIPQGYFNPELKHQIAELKLNFDHVKRALQFEKDGTQEALNKISQLKKYVESDISREPERSEKEKEKEKEHEAAPEGKEFVDPILQAILMSRTLNTRYIY